MHTKLVNLKGSSCVAALLVAAFAASTPAFAQEASTAAAQNDAPAATSGDEIVVTGIRGSLRRAIEVKRNANAVVDVISSEDIGKFPDRNVAESLSHIPGVSIDRRFGEGEKVAIHGTDPALNRMLLDGHGVASADWGGNDNDPSSRTFNYSLLAPELVERLEVYKSPEARLEDGSIGGSVIVRTRRPLDLKPNTLFGSVGYSYNDRAEKGNVRGSGLYSWKNDSETFGILVAGTYDKQNLVRGGVEFFGYSSGKDFFQTDSNGNVLNDTSGQPLLKNPNATINGGTRQDLLAARYPFGINHAFFQQERERTSLFGAVEYKPTPSTRISINGLRIDGNYNNYSQSLYVIPGAWSGALVQSLTIDRGLVTAGSFGAADRNVTQNAQLDTLVRSTKLKTDNYNGVFEWTAPDGGKITVGGGWSKATGGKTPEYLFDTQVGLPYSYAFTGNSAKVDFTGDLKNPANYFNSNNVEPQTIDGVPIMVNGKQLVAARSGGVDISKTTDEDMYGNLDMEFPVDIAFFSKLRGGLKYVHHINRQDAGGSNTYRASPYTIADLGVPTSVTPDNVFNGLNSTGSGNVFLNIPRQSVIDILNNSITIPVAKPTSTYYVSESTAAGYVQLDFEQGGFRGNIGGRLVYTQQISKSTSQVNQGGNPIFVPSSVAHDYVKFLPSFNIAYSVRPDVLVRGAVAKVIARPRFSDLAGSFSQNDVTLDAGGGNPDLKPYESTNYEISAEYYPRPGAVLSLELFRREIGSYIINTRQEGVQLFNSLTQRFASYGVSRPINGGNAKVNGVLVAGQAEIWGGFGLQANYSYADASTDNGLNMPYLSRHTVNVIPYFEKGPIQARLSYNYRSSYFRTIGRLNSIDMVAPYSQLDFSASYQLTPQVSVSVNAQNLLDETYYQYSGDRRAPTAFYKNGRIFAASVSFRM
ncbi:TonB-dependent receptor [Sphingomonas pokkalii]|uniref:TonB-dependent receptor n=1 Tax=Sphingomonas pokkalii TaxID=2175090 RepID=A0A2U0SDK6_9SPHN|nr:TonB-dependent receptor [Sphingomonas pokkalii]PVX29466.1 TonB-dependent receptor [Sphingomonas pokkalii]